MEETRLKIVVTKEDLESYRRLDQFLTEQTKLSRATIKKLFTAEEITLPFGIKLNRMPPAGTEILINIAPPPPHDLLAENIALDILYEDEDILFLNKPAGMVVHPAPKNHTGTLLNALLFHFKKNAHKETPPRVGLVHRLDQGTSGVMVVAKTITAHDDLVKLFSTHEIERSYITATQAGEEIPKAGRIESLIGRNPQNRLKMSSRVSRGKRAVTHYRLLNSNSRFHLMELKLETGRTHQIRVHLSEKLKTPILCDPIYANPPQQLQRLSEKERALLTTYPHPLLHAQKLGLTHPVTGKYLEFSIPPPQPLQSLTQGSLA